VRRARTAGASLSSAIVPVRGARATEEPEMVRISAVLPTEGVGCVSRCRGPSRVVGAAGRIEPNLHDRTEPRHATAAVLYGNLIDECDAVVIV